MHSSAALRDDLFPLQERFWERASPPPAQLSNVISTLRGQQLKLQRWTMQLGPPAGAGGIADALNAERIHGFVIYHPSDQQPAILGIHRQDSYEIPHTPPTAHRQCTQHKLPGTGTCSHHIPNSD